MILRVLWSTQVFELNTYDIIEDECDCLRVHRFILVVDP